MIIECMEISPEQIKSNITKRERNILCHVCDGNSKLISRSPIYFSFQINNLALIAFSSADGKTSFDDEKIATSS